MASSVVVVKRWFVWSVFVLFLASLHHSPLWLTTANGTKERTLGTTAPPTHGPLKTLGLIFENERKIIMPTAREGSSTTVYDLVQRPHCLAYIFTFLGT